MRPQKYLGLSKGWPMSVEPTTLPFCSMRLPAACLGNAAFATPFTSSGYATPVIRVSARSATSAGRICESMALASRQVKSDEEQIDDLDADERHHDAAEPVDEQVAAEERVGPHGAVADAAQGERDEEDDDDRVEDDRGEDRALRRREAHHVEPVERGVGR